MLRPKKRKMSAAEHLIRLAKARRRLRAQRAINATQAEEYDKLKRQHSDTSAALDKSNQQLQVLLEQQHTLHLAVLSALEKNNQHAQAVSDPMKTAIDTIKHSEKDSATDTADRFSDFSKLPSELRTMIWEMSLPGRRVFEPLIRISTGQMEFNALYLQHSFPPPSIRGVCKEAWEVTEENGRFCFGLRGSGYFGYWFNPSRDLLYINAGAQDLVGHYDFRHDLVGVMEYMKHTGACHLAFEYWLIRENGQVVQNILSWMPCCETITMVDEAETMNKGSPIKAIYPLLGSDVSSSGNNTNQQEDDRTWAEEQEDTLAGWAFANKSGKDLPKLMGIEVVRTSRIACRDLKV